MQQKSKNESQLPSAELLGDVGDGEVRVGFLDLGTSNVGEMEEARKWSLWCVRVPKIVTAEVRRGKLVERYM